MGQEPGEKEGQNGGEKEYRVRERHKIIQKELENGHKNSESLFHHVPFFISCYESIWKYMLNSKNALYKAFIYYIDMLVSWLYRHLACLYFHATLTTDVPGFSTLSSNPLNDNPLCLHACICH